MRSFRLHSAAGQVAEHLRLEIADGHLSGGMPGIHRLSATLSVNHKTVKAALELLEKEGLLISQGRGKPRRIASSPNHVPATLRIAILLYEPNDRKIDYLLDLQHLLREAGYEALFAAKTLTELGMDVKKVDDFVKANPADAWVVAGGAQPVLEWFATQSFPVFGLFGRTMDVPIASTSPRKIPALMTTLRRLVSLGHRRIVMLTRKERREPVPGFIEQAFLGELEALGIPTGPYNLSAWEESQGGFQRGLAELFRHTPPTALLIQGAGLTVATLQHFTGRGISIPGDVSLVCMDPDPAFAWCDPEISHIAYDSRPWLRRIVRWADNVARGKDDRRKSSSLAKFVEGGTIGPAKA